MWQKSYKDYEEDAPHKKERVTTGKGIVGCEMHERYGWGLTQHRYKGPNGGIVRALMALFVSNKK